MSPLAVAIQTNGKSIVAGRTCDDECLHEDFGLTQLNLDGSIDTNFGNSGMVTTDFGGSDKA